MFLDRTVSIKRQALDADNSDKESYQAIAGLQAVKMNIQPSTPQATGVIEGVFGQDYLGFTTTSGILVGDLITVSGTGSQYVVEGLQDWNWGYLPHFEYLLKEVEE